MKKKETIKTVVIVILALVIVLGGSFLVSEISGKSGKYSKSNASQANSSASEEIPAEDIPEEEQAELPTITIDQYLDYKKGEEKKIILVARPTCHFCQLFEPIIRNVVYLYGMEVNYLNTDELTEEGQSKLVSSDDYFNGNWGTPLTLIVQNDKIVDKIEGYTSKEETIQFFKDNGFISS